MKYKATVEIHVTSDSIKEAIDELVFQLIECLVFRIIEVSEVEL